MNKNKTLHQFIINDGTGYRTTEYLFESEKDVLVYYEVDEPDVIVCEKIDHLWI